MEAFYADFMVPRPGRSPAERAKGVLDLFSTYGPYDLEAWSATGPDVIRVLVYSKKTAEWRSVHFGLSLEGKVEHLSLKDERGNA